MTIGIEHVNDYPLIRFDIRFERTFPIRRSLHQRGQPYVCTIMIMPLRKNTRSWVCSWVFSRTPDPVSWDPAPKLGDQLEFFTTCHCWSSLIRTVTSIHLKLFPFTMWLMSLLVMEGYGPYPSITKSDISHMVKGIWRCSQTRCRSYFYSTTIVMTLRAGCGAVYCNRSCLWVCGCVCLWVCYHDNSKVRASILAKLGL